MSHPEQLAFFEAIADRNKAFISGAKVIEIGSYDVNGSIRQVFAHSREYLGVDLTEGPGVDLVRYGHEVDHPDGTHDLAVSGECFEHDPYWRETFANMVRMTRPGGLVAFTCASRGRPEHGTRRSENGSPGTQAVGLDYYRNIVVKDFDAFPLEAWFREWRFWYMPTHFDLYFAGIRSGGDSDAVLPTDDDVKPIRGILPWPNRIVRLPLRMAATVVRDQDRYQSLALPYWLTLLRYFRRYGRSASTRDA
jgi:SAM-dependent methyltransferase